MPENKPLFIRINDPDGEIERMLLALCNIDRRFMGSEAAVLIEQEYARRFSQPNPLITVGEAQAAGAALAQPAE